MNGIDLFKTFQTQEQAIEYLEKVRWAGEPQCPYCGSLDIGRHASGDRSMARWQCRDCTCAFAVTVGTLFHGTHMPLRDWFSVLALMLGSTKSASAYQISRDLDIRRPTVWSMMQRIRTAMADDPGQEKLLTGLVEAGETYVRGKPHKGNKHGDDETTKRGRGTSKTTVIDAIERDGQVAAKITNRRGLSAKGISKFISRFVDPAGTLPISDKYGGYNKVSETMLNADVCPIRESEISDIQANSIESFWVFMNCAWYVSQYYSSQKYVPLHAAEAYVKHNSCKQRDTFTDSLKVFFGCVA